MNDNELKQPENILPEKDNFPSSESGAEEKLAELTRNYTELQQKYALLQQRSIVEKICFENYMRFVGVEVFMPAVRDTFLVLRGENGQPCAPVKGVFADGR